MAVFPDLATAGFLIGQLARASMLAELTDGRALTAGELAARAGVSAATASAHLARLVRGGLLVSVRQGRHRYFHLAGPEVASALEALAAVGPAPVARDGFERDVLAGLRFARTCYRHLAGRLGVAIRDRLLERDLLRPDGTEHQVTRAGAEWFGRLGADVDAARRARRSFARACVDWTERRPHLAGALGDALLDALIGRGWVRRTPGERALELTTAGREGLASTLGMVLTGAETGSDGRRRGHHAQGDAGQARLLAPGPPLAVVEPAVGHVGDDLQRLHAGRAEAEGERLARL
jgi:DNA-binding transcriptional ArsR family regulator